jgi:hypothetical protein
MQIHKPENQDQTQELAIEPTRMGMDLTAIGMTSIIFTL